MDHTTFIETEHFDREYGISDLLPIATVAELLSDLAPTISAAIILPQGDFFYGKIAVASDQWERAIVLLKQKIQSACSMTIDCGALAAFSLIHELENVGYLLIGSSVKEDENRLFAIGQVIAKAFNRYMYLNYKCKMVASLHGQVVMESFDRLKEKADQLALSEEKYRLLAENLESEVEKKSRHLQEVQLTMLQQEKMAAIGQLAAGIAHEINNPIGFIISNLNTLRGNSENLLRLIDQYGRLLQSLNDREPMMTIERKIQEITNSIRQMDLDFISKDTEGLIGESLSGAERIKKIVCILCNFTHPSVESLENVNIHTGLDGALEILAPQIPSGISVIKNYGNLPLLIANLREINYVFFNLLRNAVQAVALQGTITIDTRVVEDSIEIVIRDTGHGIKKEHLNRIFDPFFTTRTIGSGPGLGLTMAYGIVKNYKGTIKVESREGQGTAITVRLPMNTKPSSHRLN